MAAPKNPLEMSDDDFEKLSGPPEVETVPETDEEKATREAAEAAASAASAAAAEATADGDDQSDDDKTETDAAGAGDEEDDEAETDAEKAARLEGEDEPELGPDGKPVVKDPVGSKAEPAPVAKVDAVADDKNKDKGTPTPIDRDKPDVTALGEFYNQIMTPFKANGKLIELKSPAEAISLMQMGANYTRKLQDIQPHRKMLMMLENNGLLDEGKLSFLIDLEKKDPEAIKKLVKDSGIDPLDIDLDKVTYRPGDHSVTNDEAAFRSTMEDLIKSDPAGQATVSTIYETWDDASKEVLWKQPELMTTIHEQRESGVYDTITAEMDRLKTLGQIPPDAPFLQAYKAVGDYLLETAEKTPVPVDPPKVVASRAAAPKSTVGNGDKANAASPTRGSPKAAGVTINPLAMADDDFLKQMEGRL